LFLTIIALLVGAGFSKTFAQKNEMNGPGILYKITGNNINEPSYLFGTYHLLKSNYLQQYPAVGKAFEAAQGVVVELEIDSAGMEKAATMGRLENTVLTSLLDKPFADSLNEVLEKNLGAPLQALNNFTPANVMVTLALVINMQDNDSLLRSYNGDPMDMSFVKNGRKRGKTVSTLETMEQQMNLLFNMYTIAEQTQQLKDFVRNLERGRKNGNDLVKAYLAHDLATMEELYKTSLAISGQEDRMVKDRNAEWMKMLPLLMKEQSQFIAVGALHLAGNDGLIALLKQQGYTVTPVAMQ
jgi:uncharacterized protein YbaP (TraB family)